MRIAKACHGLAEPAMGGAAYHCQQAAEKIVKGLLVLVAAPFRKTHAMDELADLALPYYPAIRDPLNATRKFTIWGVAYRYPGIEDIEEPEPTDEELLRALSVIAAPAWELRTATTKSGG